MQKKDKALFAARELEKLYPHVECELIYHKPFELLIATRLSARCTDKCVNTVTPLLFERYPTIETMAGADTYEVEKIIKPCGLYKVKAREIVAMCGQLMNDFGGQIPQTMDELLSLSGVGRKSANLILGELFSKPAYVCDTHVIKITNRLGLTTGTDALKVEKQLRELIPEAMSLDFCHRLVRYGRAVCTARNPRCNECVLKKICSEQEKA